MYITDSHCDYLYEHYIVGTPAENCVCTPEHYAQGGYGLQTFTTYASYSRPDPYADMLVMHEAYKTLPYHHIDGKIPDVMPEGLSCILSAEGGEQFNGDLDILRRMDDDVHIRMIALTWNYENQLGVPACLDETRSLKTCGLEFLKEMDLRGIAADVSHLNIGGFWDVVDHTAVPPLASHSNCRALCGVTRNLWDDQIRALINRGGFIGVSFFAEFIAEGRPATLDDLAAHIEHICELGGEKIVGFGSDFDGIESWPDGLAHPGETPNLLEALRARGFEEALIEDIAGRNFLRYLRRCEAAAGRV